MVGGPLLLFAPFLLGRRVLYWGTVLFQFYPWREMARQALLSGHLPLWNPLVGNGAPLLANYQSAVFYPPNWLMVLVHPFAPLPFRLVEIQIVVHYFLAGLFMFHLARDYTRDTVSALFGGILFMFSGAMIAHAVLQRSPSPW